jgi:hypothetical protein
MAVPSETSVPSPLSDAEVEAWFEEEDSESSERPSNIPKSIEQKYADSQLRVIRTNMDLSLHNLRQSLSSDSSYINRSPDYQRRHRWDDRKRSQLIESILMNIPVPPVFLFENEYNQYEVMDGRQRLDTIIDYLDNGFELKGLEFWRELVGKRYKELPTTIQRGLLRRTISAIVLLAETNMTVGLEEPDIRMALFRRLNTGGITLNPQELRNALYPSEFSGEVKRLARSTTFTRVWGIPPYTSEEERAPPEELVRNPLYRTMADCELVLRFFAIRETIAGDLKGSLRTLLDRCMDRHRHDTKATVVRLGEEFKLCLDTLSNLFDGKPFRLPEGRMSRPLYDALMVAYSLRPQSDLLLRAHSVREELQRSLTKPEEYGVLIGRGNTVEAIKSRVELASKVLSAG